MDNKEPKLGLIGRIKEWWNSRKENKIKRLPETIETTKEQQSFMDKYPTVKTPEQLKRESKKGDLEVYYNINGEDYEIPGFQRYMRFMKEKGIKVLLQKMEEGKYNIKDDVMTEEEIYKMLRFMLKYSGYHILVPINQFFSEGKYEKERERKDEICKSMDYNEFFAEKQYLNGNITVANDMLKKEMIRLLKYNKEYIEFCKKIESEYEK